MTRAAPPSCHGVARSPKSGAGVADYEFTRPLTIEEMLAEADRALYARKRGMSASRSG